MSYKIETMSIAEFVDNRMKLPRFQRRATWNKKQNFELCISIFQDYPVGVVIVNEHSSTSWLLDGRQRRTALAMMRENPINLYEWAKAYIGFKANEDALQIKEEFWKKINQYLQKDKAKEKGEKSKEDAENLIDVYDGEEENIDTSFDTEKQKQGLEVLLNLILMVHQNTSAGYRWVRLFDFSEYFDRLVYAPKNENGKINPVRLRSFILNLHNNISGEVSKEDFLNHYYNEMDVKSEKKKKFEEKVEQNWVDLSNSVELIHKAELIIKRARIGVITLTNVSQLDALNIFSRINSGGTLLKAEELLSAKPFWNYEVYHNDPQVRANVENLYKRLKVEPEKNIVRWDIAATLLSRIKDKSLFFESYDGDNDEVQMDQVSLGFKLISSVFVGGMSIKDVSKLEEAEVDWVQGIDDLVYEINSIAEVLMSKANFFKYLHAWNMPIARLLGSAIVLEYVTILLRSWKQHGEPQSPCTEQKAFIRDAKALLDRLIFEYATKVWRGSGDSKMANDIKNWHDRIKPIETNQWIDFITSVSEGKYNGQDVNYKTLRPVLYYFYALQSKAPSLVVTDNEVFEIDHILPQDLFKNNSNIDFAKKDSIVNLALLPKKDNISKKDKVLKDITDDWLTKSISEYADISKDDFAKFSSVSSIDALKELRKPIFLKVFENVRAQHLVE